MLSKVLSDGCFRAFNSCVTTSWEWDTQDPSVPECTTFPQSPLATHAEGLGDGVVGANGGELDGDQPAAAAAA